MRRSKHGSKSIALVLGLVASLLSPQPANATVTAPTNVSAVSTSEPNTAENSATARVEWTVVSSAVAYSVVGTLGQQNVAGSTPVCQNNTCVSFLSDLTGGGNYAVRVSALDADGNSAASEPVSLVAVSVPSAPGNLTSVAGNGTVTLNWSEPSTLGGLTLDQYVLIDPSNRETLIAGDSRSYTFSNLVNGTAYTYRIAAVNPNGRSTAVSFPGATPIGGPGTPARPTVSTTSATLTATWVAPSDGGSALTGYNVRLFLGGEQLREQRVSATPTNYTFANLDSGNYSVRVQAINAIGVGDFSPASVATPIGASLQPQTISFQAVASQTAGTSISLSVSATSGLGITLTASGPCSVDSPTKVVTFASAGTCVITANQAGSGVYLPTSGQLSIAIVAASPSGSQGGGGGTSPVTGGGSVSTQSPVTLSPTTSPTTSTTASPTTSESAPVENKPEPSVPSKPVKASVGSFQGYLAIYLAGLEGKRVSIRVAGKWIVLPKVKSNFERVIRKTGSGFRVSVQVFVSGKLTTTTSILTK